MNKLLLALVLLTLTNPAIASTAELSQFNFNFFADFRYTNYHVQNNPYVASGHPESGFGLEDGAFYAKYEKNNLATIIDVAFRRSKEFDTNNSSNHPNASPNNNFAIGTDKSQIYVRYKVKPNLIFNIGQFDTIFGVELNDSKDRIFGKAGLIFDNTLPSTHSGVMLEYTFLEKYYMKVLGANPNNKGSYGSSLSGDDKIELGGALGYGNEFLHAQIGYLSRKINRASSASDGIRSLMDITVGGVLGPLALDLEYVRIYDASKNTITPDNALDGFSNQKVTHNSGRKITHLRLIKHPELD